MNIEIANRLVKMRKAHGYSQEELAEKLGISRQAVSKWERAESSPDTDNLIMLSRLYGVSLDELLSTEDEIPTPDANEEEEEKTEGGTQKDSVHVSFIDGINVTDEDGSRVHIGWDGIRVNDPNTGEGVRMGGDGEEDDAGDYGFVNENGEWINSYINNIEVDRDGVTFTENGERAHHAWNSEKNGKKRYVHRTQSRKTGKWRTTVISEDGHKVVVDSSRPISDKEIGSHGVKHRVSGFPYAVLVTGVFLILGFLKGWWHPAWILFLTIPVYYTIEGMIRSKRLNALDIIVPVAVTGAYVALGLIYGMWHPLWLIMLLIPLYYALSFALRRNVARGWPTAVYSILAAAVYVTLGCVFGRTAWSVGWLLFLTVPMFDSIAQSIRKKRGARGLVHFPWELLIVAAYLFVGLMWGVWHPTWIAFLLIPVLRWLISRMAGSGRNSSEEEYVDVDDDDDDDDDDEDDD